MSNEKPTPNRPIHIILKCLPPDWEWEVFVPGSGGADHKLDPVDPSEEPDETNTTVEVEVRQENPRWVKIGSRWYYIG